MKHLRAIRRTSSQHLCIFCEARLSTVSYIPSLSPPLRRLWTDAGNAYSPANTAAAPGQSGWDPSSTLTAAEKAERDRLRVLRQQRQAAQDNVVAQSRKQENARASTFRRISLPDVGQTSGTKASVINSNALQRSDAISGAVSALSSNLRGKSRDETSGSRKGTSRARSRQQERQPTLSSKTQNANRQPPKSSSMMSTNAEVPRFTFSPLATQADPSATSSTRSKRSSFVAEGWNLGQTFNDKQHEKTTPAINREIDSTRRPDEPIKSSGRSNGSDALMNGLADAHITAASSKHAEPSADTWIHLRRNDKATVTSPGHSVAETPADDHSQELSDEWVDQAFERHLREREKNQILPPSGQLNIRYTSGVNDVETPHKDNRVCFRCGQPGHVAQSCKKTSDARQANTVSDDGETGRSTTDSQRNHKAIKWTRPAETRLQDPADQETFSAAGEAEERRARRLRKFAEEDSRVDKEEKQTSRSRRGEEKDRKKGRPSKHAYERSDEDDAIAAIRDEKNAQKAARKALQEEKRAAKVTMLERRRSQDATPVNLSRYMSVAQLSQALDVHYESFVDKLETLGYDDLFPGKILNAETSGMIAMEFNFEPVFDEAEHEAEERDLYAQAEIDDKEFLPVRPPVVTIMGHVDHGKTTILDYIRKSSVAAGEAGGITQHIGAFSVPMTSSGKTITFLDTPGHAAFLAMRQRGANVTDIVILVVAADDSVKPQTLEAIKHAKAAGVPMIVAVNKIDKEEADLQRVKQDLARHQIDIEDYGGETQVVPVSGKTGQGMDDLEETIVTLSEILDHRAPTDGPVEGWVLEAETKKSGRVATVLVRRGTLRPGTILVAGKTWTRVRTLQNESGKALKEVGPGMPVEVDGWRDQPAAGDEVLEASDEQKATDVVTYREELDERARASADMDAINDSRRADQLKKAEGDAESHRASESGHMSMPFIVKADVSGSAEAVSSYILSVSHSMILPTVLNASVGQIYESDIDLAAVTGAHIVSFNQPIDERIRSLAAAKQVQIIENNIIYRVLEDVKSVLEDRLPPIISSRVLGEAEISASFEISLTGRKKMKIAGCKIRNGIITRNARVRVMRKDKKIYDGTLASLKNVKKDVEEMRKGSECGMGFATWEAFEIGDSVQAYEEISEKRRI